MKQPVFEVLGLKVSAKDKLIIDEVNLSLRPGEVQVLIGPNGSGKSTLALAAAGSPHYQIIQGKIKLGGRDITSLSPARRARLGLFVAFQNPPAIEGVTLLQLMRAATGSNLQSIFDFHKTLVRQGRSIGFSAGLIEREVNSDLSGGEKKRSEMLQMLVLEPSVAILDEIDSGLDREGLQAISQVISHRARRGLATLVITHSDRLLRLLKPSRIYEMSAGKVRELK